MGAAVGADEPVGGERGLGEAGLVDGQVVVAGLEPGAAGVALEFLGEEDDGVPIGDGWAGACTGVRAEDLGEGGDEIAARA